MSKYFEPPQVDAGEAEMEVMLMQGSRVKWRDGKFSQDKQTAKLGGCVWSVIAKSEACHVTSGVDCPNQLQ